MVTKDPYRIRSFVPDFDAISAEIAAQSLALAARSLIWSVSAYGTRARERIDIFLPSGLRAGAPIHMFVHGGYWRSGNKSDYSCVAAPVLAVGGIAAIVKMTSCRLPGFLTLSGKCTGSRLAFRSGGGPRG